jgi:hypothetical protein
MARAVEREHHPSTHHPRKPHAAIHATMSEIHANRGTPRHVTKPPAAAKAAKPKSKSPKQRQASSSSARRQSVKVAP